MSIDTIVPTLVWQNNMVSQRLNLNLASSITHLWFYSWLLFYILPRLIYSSVAPDNMDDGKSQGTVRAGRGEGL